MSEKSEQLIQCKLSVGGMDCANCANKIEKVVSDLPGVAEAKVNLVSGRLSARFDPKSISEERIREHVTRLGYQVKSFAPTGSVTFRVEGMDCADETGMIEKRLRSLEGVIGINFNLVAAEAKVRFDPAVTDIDSIQKAIQETGMKAHLQSEGDQTSESWWSRHKLLMLTVVSGLFTAVGMFHERFHLQDAMTFPLYLVAMLTGGLRIAIKGYQEIRHRSLGMNFLMTVAVIGAAAIGEWSEGAMVVFLFALANLLESYSMDRARRAIRSLMDLTPLDALVIREGIEKRVPVDEVQVNETVIVRPGEKIPLDGEVLIGDSTVNQAPITGESMPVPKATGDPVFAGTINQAGSLEIRITHPADDSTLSRIIHMVEEAQEQKAPSQRFVDRFARIYTPVVLILAVLVAFLPTLIVGAPFLTWFYRALVLLVISCPCALVISTPVAVVSGLTAAARSGVLIKGGLHLEQAGSLDVLALDKTGTLTHGKPQVTEVIPFEGHDEVSVLRLAASVERRSEHPLAEAVRTAAQERGIDAPNPSDFQALAGLGARAVVEGRTVHVGNHHLFEQNGFCTPELDREMAQRESKAQSIVIVGDDKRAIGIIILSDELRGNAADALLSLRKAGISKLIMLTGDHAGTAKAIASKLDIDEVHAELLPQDKLNKLRDLQDAYRRVGMVGDGVNDAPALAAATVGFAMGSAGTDAALETADVALMSDDLGKLAFTIRLSRRTLSIIRSNIVLAIGIKAAFLSMAVFGVATLWMAVFADMGASLIVVANSLRLLGFNQKSGLHDDASVAP